MRKSASVQSVSKAFVLLKAFTPQEPTLTATQLAHKVRMPMSTVHRLLTGLTQDGMLARDGSGRLRWPLRISVRVPVNGGVPERSW